MLVSGVEVNGVGIELIAVIVGDHRLVGSVSGSVFHYFSSQAIENLIALDRNRDGVVGEMLAVGGSLPHVRPLGASRRVLIFLRRELESWLGSSYEGRGPRL